LPDALEPLSLVRSWPPDEPVAYWRRPALEIATAGVCFEACVEDAAGDRFAGVAASLERIFGEAVADGWQRPFALGGFRFGSSAGEDATWPGFPPASLVIPRLAIVRRRGVTFAVVNRLVASADSEEDVAAGILRDVALCAQPAESPVPRAAGTLESRNWWPDAGDWGEAVVGATQAIDRGKLQKVVLARRLTVHASTRFDPVGVAAALGRRYRGAFVYLFRRGGIAFVGASPELLVALSGGALRSFPLAGTIRRGGDPAEAARRLKDDPKERAEHALVVDAIRASLGEVCETLRVPQAPSTLRAGPMLHLGTRISGRMRRPESAVTLAGRLHPTPAVGGTPWPAAREIIEGVEGFDRGWYAGPVGWVDSAGDGEFALALRCALLEGPQAILFAGAGIVAGSRPEAELAETELKARAMLAVLG
jgi:isochorismate synthase